MSWRIYLTREGSPHADWFVPPASDPDDIRQLGREASGNLPMRVIVDLDRMEDLRILQETLEFEFTVWFTSAPTSSPEQSPVPSPPASEPAEAPPASHPQSAEPPAPDAEPAPLPPELPGPEPPREEPQRPAG